MVFTRQSGDNEGGEGSSGGGSGSKGGKSIFDRPELRGSVNRRSASPAEERIIRVDSRKKITSSSSTASASSSSSTRVDSTNPLKDRLRKISVESLVSKPTASTTSMDRSRSNTSTGDASSRGNGRDSVLVMSEQYRARCEG